MTGRRAAVSFLAALAVALLVAVGCTGGPAETRTGQTTPQGGSAGAPAVTEASTPSQPSRSNVARTATLVPSSSPPPDAALSDRALAGQSVFAQVASSARPAVVSIAVRVRVVDPFSLRLVSAVRTGSGVIIDPRGYILTNEHVIEGGQRIEVTTDDEQTYVAEVVGRDPATDLALIKIFASTLFPSLRFASPESYAAGDWVIAIGNALGLAGGPTVTVGVIGALERTIAVDGDVLSDLVQTDAAINEGNSGGPLINLNGEIVGINTIVAHEKSAGQGIGFAVSAFTASRVAQALMEFGRVPWAWLGVDVEELSPSRALELNLPVRKGILVKRLSRGGPAHVAGLQLGDVLLKLDENVLNRVRDLDVLLRDRYKAGDAPVVTFLRGSAEATAKVTLSEAPRP